MTPQDRADAATLWRLFSTLADTSVRLMTAPHPTVATEVLTISAPAMLLLARERQYWHDLAQSRDALVDNLAQKQAPVLVAKPHTKGADTPERIALLRELWPSSCSVSEIAERLNALPGVAIADIKTLYRWAHNFGLQVPRERPTGAEAAARAATAERTPVPVPPPAPTPAVSPSPPPAAPAPATAAPIAQTRVPVRADHVWQEARDLLAEGKSVISVARETGLTTEQVRDLRFGMRNPTAAKARP